LNLSENEALLPLLAAGARNRSDTASTHSIPIPRFYVVGLLRVVYQASGFPDVGPSPTFICFKSLFSFFYIHKDPSDNNGVNSLYFCDMFRPVGFDRLQVLVQRTCKRKLLHDGVSPLEMLNTVMILKLVFQKVE